MCKFANVIIVINIMLFFRSFDLLEGRRQMNEQARKPLT